MRWAMAIIVLSLAMAAVAVPRREATPVQSEAELLLERVGLEPGRLVSESGARRALEEKITGAQIESVLRRLLSSCLEQSSDCAEAPFGDKRSQVQIRAGKSAATLIRLLERLGGPESRPLLLKLAARGFYEANSARMAIQAREMRAAFPSRPCIPPTAEELSAMSATLGNFAAVRSRAGQLVAEALTAAEREDLAYFLVAVADAGAPLGEVEELSVSSPEAHLRHALLDASAQELRAAKLRADLHGIDTATQRLVTMLGYPGPMRWYERRTPYLIRQWAEVKELLGEYAEAEALYRRASLGGGSCGGAATSEWERLVRGAIRTGEQTRGCRRTVAERLLAMDGEWDEEGYGTKRLTDAGFGLARLYRGALVTRYRDVEAEQLRRVLGEAPEPLRTQALRRLQSRGPEAWAQRVWAIEGFAGAAQRDALDPLLRIASEEHGEPARRALAAVGVLAARPACDPCASGLGCLGTRGGGSYVRSIRPLSRSCASALKAEERDALTLRLLPLLSHPEGELREAAARTLGEVASPLAVPALEALRSDTFSSGHELTDDGETYRPYFDVRVAADEALENIAQLEHPTPEPEGVIEEDSDDE